MFPFMFPFRGHRYMHFGLFGGLLRLLLLVFGIKYLVNHTGRQKPVYTLSQSVGVQPQSSALPEDTKHNSGPEPAPDPFVGPVK